MKNAHVQWEAMSFRGPQLMDSPMVPNNGLGLGLSMRSRTKNMSSGKLRDPILSKTPIDLLAQKSAETAGTCGNLVRYIDARASLYPNPRYESLICKEVLALTELHPSNCRCFKHNIPPAMVFCSVPLQRRCQSLLRREVSGVSGHGGELAT